MHLLEFHVEDDVVSGKKLKKHWGSICLRERPKPLGPINKKSVYCFATGHHLSP